MPDHDYNVDSGDNDQEVLGKMKTTRQSQNTATVSAVTAWLTCWCACVCPQVACMEVRTWFCKMDLDHLVCTKKIKKKHFDTWSSQLAFRAHLQTRTWIPVRVAHICSSHSLLNQTLRKRKSLLLSPSAPAPPPFPRTGADRQDVGWQSLKHPVWLHTSHTTSNSIMPLDYTHVLHPAENHLVKPDSLSLTFMCYISTCASEFRMSFGFDL